MQNYDRRKELAPRDVVSHSIIFEARRTGSDEFYIDISHKDPEFVKNRFPMIYKNLLEAGYDMTKEPVPIFPCHHYLMGGINVDTFARTNIDGLYACGECSHTGVHGNNRLASNSLLEALVFSRRAAADIAEKLDKSKTLESYPYEIDESAPHIPSGLRREIRARMQKSYFVLPDIGSLQDSLTRVAHIREMLVKGNYKLDRDYVEARSLATVAYIVLTEAVEIAFSSVPLDYVDYEHGF